MSLESWARSLDPRENPLSALATAYKPNLYLQPVRRRHRGLALQLSNARHLQQQRDRLAGPHRFQS